jgi:N-acetylglucosamine-6-sulfatase
MPRAGTSRSISVGIAAGAVLMVAGLYGAPGDSGEAASGRSSARPNIILIVTDDQTDAQLRPDVMPNVMNLLARQGTTFANAIVTTPLCCPSRATMLTGQYAHNHRVLSNRYGLLAGKGNTLPVWLDRAGYRTIHIGKYMNGYESFAGPTSSGAPGWDDWYTALTPRRYWDYDLQLNGRTKHFGSGDGDYLTSVLHAKATSLVRRYGKRKKPFYIQLDEFAPHPAGPHVTCRGRTPQPHPRDRDLFEDEPLPTAASLNEDDVRDKPSFIRDRTMLSEDDVARITRRWRCSLASLRSVDDGVAALSRALEDVGELENTVIIFTSDNGSYYGEHRIPAEKHFPYTEGISVPLVVSGRVGGLSLSALSEVSLPVANIDLAPTILDLAKAGPCRSANSCRVMDGRSLVPLLRGKTDKWPHERALLLELGPTRAEILQGRPCRYRGILVPGAMYVKHTAVAPPGIGKCKSVDEIEYYDLGSDHFQLDNLHGAPGDSTNEERRLARRLRRLRNCSGIKGRDPHREGRAYCR